MVTRVITGTITGGYTLSSQYTELSITSTGVISGGYYGVVSTHKATIANNGSIINSGAESIDLRAGGTVINGSNKNSAALINQGVYILNAPGSVTNFGTITATTNGATGKYIFGVYLGDGGTINNGGKGSYAAYIGGAGINITNAAGVVKNFGRIEANNVGGVGISLYAGSVNNGSATDRTALISGAAIGLATSHAATATNFGTIQSGGLGVQLAGGKLTNGSVSDTQAEIAGAYGVQVTGGATLRNFGAIQGTSGGAVYINKIGAGASVSLVNGAGNDKTALIKGATYGVFINASAATVTNYGVIDGVGGTAVQFNSASDTLIVEGGSSLVGVARGGGGMLQLATGRGTITGLGTSFTGFASYVVQAGGIWTLSGTNTLGAGTTLTNRGTLSVAGSLGENGSFANLGAVSGHDGGLAVQLTGGALTNSGAITGGAGGAAVDGGTAVISTGGTLTSSGAITGGGGGGSSGARAGGDGGTAMQAAGGSLTSSAAIVGGAGGASQGGAGGGGGTAVQMSGGVFTNRGTVAGGAGGAGGSASAGGAGGVGVYLTNGGSFTNISTDLIQGGAGGAGGGGGAGGIAADVVGGYLTNSGVINGGAGGLGNNTGNGAGGAGAFVSQNGDLINKGQLTGGATGGGGATAVGVVISGAGTVDNFGTISGGAYAVDITGTGGLLKVETGSVLNGSVQGGGGTLELATGSGTITSLGATGTISGTEAVTFSSFGSYRIDTGTSWTLAGTDTVATATTISDNGSLSSAGSLTVAGRISGSGSLKVNGGTATIVAGAVVNVATLTLSAGTTFLNESLNYTGAFADGPSSTLALGSGDQLSLSGSSRLGGLITGAGTISVGNASIEGFSTGGTSVMTATGVVTETGSMGLGGGSASQAALLVAKGATWTMFSGIVMIRGEPDSTLDVEGTYVGSCASAPSRVESATLIGGVIEAAAGTLNFSSTLTGTGIIKIDGGATFQVESSVASTLTATFNGSSATLAVSHTDTSFFATIAGFATSDAIDLLNTAATGASVNGNDQLVIVNGTKVVDTLQLTGSYAGDTFTTTSDGNGGTDVMVGSGPSPPIFVAAMAGFGAGAGHALVPSAFIAHAYHANLLVRQA